MNINDLTIGEARQLVQMFGATQQPQVQQQSELIGRYVVVRTYSAGVHVGVLKSRDGREVVLTEARRIWSWQGANTLNEIANLGVGDGSRVSDAVSLIELTEAIEIIATTDAGEMALRAAKWTAR